jgi:hypothetical protein
MRIYKRRPCYLCGYPVTARSNTMSLESTAAAPLANDVATAIWPSPFRPTSQAIISINAFNVHNPPVPLRFGEFKPSIFNKAHMHRLVKTFLKVSFDPFNWDSMIPILLSTGDLNPRCINTNPALGDGAPNLILSKAGMERQDIIACDGYHRHCAVKHTLRYFDQKINKSSSHLADLDMKLANNYFGVGDAAIITAKTNKLWGKVQNLENRMADFKKWGVVVYDIGGCHVHNLHLIYLSEHFKILSIKKCSVLTLQLSISMALGLNRRMRKTAVSPQHIIDAELSLHIDS